MSFKEISPRSIDLIFFVERDAIVKALLVIPPRLNEIVRVIASTLSPERRAIPRFNDRTSLRRVGRSWLQFLSCPIEMPISSGTKWLALCAERRSEDSRNFHVNFLFFLLATCHCQGHSREARRYGTGSHWPWRMKREIEGVDMRRRSRASCKKRLVRFQIKLSYTWRAVTARIPPLRTLARRRRISRNWTTIYRR